MVDGLWWRLAICDGGGRKVIKEVACNIEGGVRWVLGLDFIR